MKHDLRLLIASIAMVAGCRAAESGAGLASQTDAETTAGDPTEGGSSGATDTAADTTAAHVAAVVRACVRTGGGTTVGCGPCSPASSCC